MEWLVWIESLLPEFAARRALVLGVLIFTPAALLLRLISQKWIPVTGGQRLDRASMRGQAWSLVNNIGLILMNSFVWVILLDGVYKTFSNADEQDWFWRLPPADETWMANWPITFQIVFIIFLLDFKGYWAHRLMHSRLMWPVHALHHSDRHMNFATVYRIHFLEGIFRTLVTVTMLGWLNLPLAPAILASVFILWYAAYIHTELPWGHGALRRIFASPENHRWHHADEPEAYGKNLALVFPFIDVMFGTYYDPGPCRGEIGVKDVKDDMISGQLYPFVQAWKWLSQRVGRQKAIEMSET